MKNGGGMYLFMGSAIEHPEGNTTEDEARQGSRKRENLIMHMMVSTGS